MEKHNFYVTNDYAHQCIKAVQVNFTKWIMYSINTFVCNINYYCYQTDVDKLKISDRNSLVQRVFYYVVL